MNCDSWLINIYKSNNEYRRILIHLTWWTFVVSMEPKLGKILYIRC